jgi:hypothetical protein
MALSNSAQSGLSFLDGLIAKLPESLRAEATALVTKIKSTPEAEIATPLQYVGDGVLARPDYSRVMNELKVKQDEIDALAQEQLTWWTTNSAALNEYRTIKPEYDRLKGTDPNPDPNPAPALDMKTIGEELERRDRAFAGAFALGVTLSARHQLLFNEALDMNELMGDPNVGQPVKGQPGRVYGLQDAYNTKHGERVTAKAKEAEDTRIKKLVDDGVAERLRQQPQIQPYPLRPEPSPLDALLVKDGPASHTVDTATTEYERLQAARAVAGG